MRVMRFVSCAVGLAALAVASIAGPASAVRAAQPAPVDLLIVNARVLDGT